MDDLKLISRGLYRVVGAKLGTEKIVDMRRRVMALEQSLDTARLKYNERREDEILSGSKCEGFRFASSDIDIMIVRRGIRVIFSMDSEIHTTEQTVLMAECHITKPGFAMLKLSNESSNPFINYACVQHESGIYISSDKWKDLFTAIDSNAVTHGPCTTAVIGTTERDFAFCLKSDRLPESSHGFIRRLHKAGWPSTPTLQKIISGGCHFVAIGARGSRNELLEWRISFSSAEKLLIHSMNHVQFLCYGLLKIFLKEAIEVNEDVKGLLCSYFLKTALFWEISENCINWNSSNFLSCFWICFKRLLHWINNQYCPNFFIPENNMFAGKIHGEARTHLLSHLVSLYEEGYHCLIRCPSIQTELFCIIQQPVIVTAMESYDDSDKCVVETKLILEIWNSKPGLKADPAEAINALQDIEHLILMNNTDLEQNVLQIWKKYSIQNVAVLTAFESSLQTNDQDPIERLITMMPDIDVSRHLLYTALRHYRSGHFHTAICVLRESKMKLQHPHLLYTSSGDVEKYRAAGGEHKPFTQMMKEIVAWPIELETCITMPELSLEHNAAANHSMDILSMPPLVLTNFLLFLCYFHIQNWHDGRLALQDLAALVQYDDGYHIDSTEKAISWQVLGICQQMSGDRQEAYQSYTNALQQKWCEVGLATLARIQTLAH